MSTCAWQFHGVTRHENGDGTVTLTLTGHRYTSGKERKAGAAAVIEATEPCEARTVPQQFADLDGERVQLMESGVAQEMVTAHCGTPYTVVWQGKGWTVEVSSFYSLWQVTA